MISAAPCGVSPTLPPPQQPRPLDEQYTLQAKLGDGMTACVYIARENATGRLYACKLAQRKRHPNVWGRLSHLFRREAALLQEIGAHESIVKAHAFFETESECAIMMDVVPGGDCQQLLQRQGALSEQTVFPMVRQLHSALRHLHGLQVIHRDVKLENVLIDTRAMRYEVKLCDFGHACHMDEAARDRSFFGTPGYTAPEVVRGPVWSAAADVWAMGVVMYALLANALPFETDSPHWLRPPDFSGRAWWHVSLDAKLLLQTLLEPQVAERATIDGMASSPWLSGTATPPPPRQGLGCHSYSVCGLAKPLVAQPAPRHHMPHAASWSNLDRSAAHGHDSAQPAASFTFRPHGAQPLEVAPTSLQREVMAAVLPSASGLKPSHLPPKKMAEGVRLASEEPAVAHASSPPAARGGTPDLLMPPPPSRMRVSRSCHTGMNLMDGANGGYGFAPPRHAAGAAQRGRSRHVTFEGEMPMRRQSFSCSRLDEMVVEGDEQNSMRLASPMGH